MEVVVGAGGVVVGSRWPKRGMVEARKRRAGIWKVNAGFINIAPVELDERRVREGGVVLKWMPYVLRCPGKQDRLTQ